jgi:hypothetical protein
VDEVTRFTVHQDVAIVEHDDSTRQRLEGGEVWYGSVTGTNTVFTMVSYDPAVRFGRPPQMFDTGSGWAAAHAGYRWRLMPLCDRGGCWKPVLGEPVTAEDDPMRREFCSGECLDSGAEASHGAFR